jgi:hypothetical protein
MPRYHGSVKGNSARLILELQDVDKGHTLNAEGDAVSVLETFGAWLFEKYAMTPGPPQVGWLTGERGLDTIVALRKSQAPAQPDADVTQTASTSQRREPA